MHRKVSKLILDTDFALQEEAKRTFEEEAALSEGRRQGYEEGFERGCRETEERLRAEFAVTLSGKVQAAAGALGEALQRAEEKIDPVIDADRATMVDLFGKALESLTGVLIENGQDAALLRAVFKQAVDRAPLEKTLHIQVNPALKSRMDAIIQSVSANRAAVHLEESDLVPLGDVVARWEGGTMRFDKKRFASDIAKAFEQSLFGEK